MSIRTLLAAVVAVAVVLAVFLTLQAYQQTVVKRLVIMGPAGISDLDKALALEFNRRYGVNATFVALLSPLRRFCPSLRS